MLTKTIAVLSSNDMHSHTLASRGRDLGERVITAVTLATYDPSLAGTLSSLRVAGSGLGAHRETLAGVASVVTLWAIVVVLQGGRGERMEVRDKSTNSNSNSSTWTEVSEFTLQRHSPVVLLQSG